MLDVWEDFEDIRQILFFYGATLCESNGKLNPLTWIKKKKKIRKFLV